MRLFSPYFHLTNNKGKKLVSLEFLLSLVNSRLLDFYFKSYGKLMDYRYEYYPKPVSMLRIKIAKNQRNFEKLAERVMTAKRSDPKADTMELEREIDQLVYKLYDLSEEEIKIVEGETK